jgi:TM2 domain-containing membrane protein YozV
MAGLCAFLFPGLGHLILGKPFQALLWCVGIFVGYLCLIVPGIILHIISIVDAAKQDRKQQAETMARAMRGAQQPPQQQRPVTWQQPPNWKPRR